MSRGKRSPSSRTLQFRRRLGRAVRRWRVQQAELTREQLAVKLGVSLRTLSRIEAGLGDPRASELWAMEKICPGLVASVFHIEGTSC